MTVNNDIDDDSAAKHGDSHSCFVPGNGLDLARRIESTCSP